MKDKNENLNNREHMKSVEKVLTITFYPYICLDY